MLDVFKYLEEKRKPIVPATVRDPYAVPRGDWSLRDVPPPGEYVPPPSPAPEPVPEPTSIIDRLKGMVPDEFRLPQAPQTGLVGGLPVVTPTEPKPITQPITPRPAPTLKPPALTGLGLDLPETREPAVPVDTVKTPATGIPGALVSIEQAKGITEGREPQGFDYEEWYQEQPAARWMHHFLTGASDTVGLPTVKEHQFDPETAGDYVAQTIGSIVPYIVAAYATAPLGVGTAVGAGGAKLATTLKLSPKAASVIGKGLGLYASGATMAVPVAGIREFITSLNNPDTTDFKQSIVNVIRDAHTFGKFRLIMGGLGGPLGEGAAKALGRITSPVVMKAIGRSATQGAVAINLDNIIRAVTKSVAGAAPAGATIGIMDSFFNYMANPEEYTADMAKNEIVTRMLFFTGMNLVFSLGGLFKQGLITPSQIRAWQEAKKIPPGPQTVTPDQAYRELGVQPGTPLSEIKKAYRNLSRRYHPDRNPGDPVAEERMKRITVAYATIVGTQPAPARPAPAEPAPPAPGRPPGPAPVSPVAPVARPGAVPPAVAPAPAALPPAEAPPVEPALALPVTGWHTPVTAGQEAAADLQSAGLPRGTFVALDKPFESDVHDASKAVKRDIDVKNTFDPDGLINPANKEAHGKIWDEMTHHLNTVKADDNRAEMTKFLQGKGFDSYVRGIDGDPGNRELIVFETAPVEAAPEPAPVATVLPAAPPAEPKSVADFAARLDARHDPGVADKQALIIGNIRLDNYDHENVRLFQQLGIQETGVRLGDAEETGKLRYMLEKGDITQADWDKHVQTLQEEGKIKGVPAEKPPGIPTVTTDPVAGDIAPATPDTITGEVATATGTKEPWEMTREEFTAGANTPDEIAIAKSAHPQHVKRALEEGKPVPREVLEQYKNNVWAQKAIEKLDAPATPEPATTPEAPHEDMTSKHLAYINESGAAITYRPSKENKKKPLEPVGKLEQEVMAEVGEGLALENVSQPLIYASWARQLGNKRRALINLLDRGVLKIERRPERQPIPGSTALSHSTDYIVPVKLAPAPEAPAPELVPEAPASTGVSSIKDYLTTQQPKHMPRFEGRKGDLVIHKMGLPKRTTLPILENVAVQDGVMTSTDLDVNVVSKTDLPDGIYSLVGKEADLQAVGMDNLSLDEYPEVAISTGTQGRASLNLKNLQPELKRALEYVSKDEGRPLFRNILLDVKGNEASLAATDTYRLYLAKFPLEGIEDGQYLIPQRALEVLLKDKAIGNVSMSVDDKIVSFDTGRWVLTARMGAGKFPNVQGVIPERVGQSHVFSKVGLAGKLKELRNMKPAGQIGGGTFIRTDKGFDVTIQSGVTDKPYTVSIPAEARGGGSVMDPGNIELILPIKVDKLEGYPEDLETWVIANLRFLEDVVKHAPGDKVYMGWTNIVGPLLFRGDEIALSDQMKREEIVGRAEPGTKAFVKEALGGREIYSRPKVTRPDPKEAATRLKAIKAMHGLAPIRLGKVYRPGAAAVYKVREGVIRTKTRYARDLQVLSHEVGHAVDGLINMKADQFNNELVNMPYVRGLVAKYPSTSKKTQVSEGIAEFMRMWFMETEQAKSLAPGMYDHFEATLSVEYPSVYNELLDIRNRLRHYQFRLSDDPVERAQARAAELLGHDEKKPGTVHNIKQWFYNESRVLKNPLHRFFTVMSDNFLPMEMVEATAKGLNLEETDVWKYGRFETSQGFENTLINVGQPELDLTTGMPAYSREGVEMIGDSFMQIVGKISRLGDSQREGAEHLKAFEEYMVLRHAVEQERLVDPKTGERAPVQSGLVSDDIPGKPTTVRHLQEAVNKIEATEHGKVYKEQAEKLFHRDRGLRQYVYRMLEGVYGQDEIEKYLGKYDLAVPSKRQNLHQTGDKSKMAYSERYLKGEKGADLPVVSPLLTMLREIRAISKIHKVHMTNKAFFDMAKKLPKEVGPFVEKVRLPVQVTRISLGEVIEQLTAKMGVENKTGEPFALEDTDVNGIILDIFRPIKKSQAHKNLIVHWDRGKAVAYEVFDDDLYNSLLRIPGWQFPPTLTKIANLAATPFRVGHIVNNRWPFRNFARDTQIAFAHSEHGFIPVLSWLDGAMTLFFGHSKVGRAVVEKMTKDIELDKNRPQLSIFKHYMKKEKNYMDMIQAMGGTMKSVDLLNEFDADKLAEKLAKSAWEHAHITVGPSTPWQLMKAMVLASEMSTNIGENKMALRKGRDLMSGILSGKDITVDHNMSGKYTKDLKKMFPFGQPVFHGHYKLWRQMKDPNKRWRTLMKYFLGITIPTLATYILCKDNPHYQEKPRWQKDWALLIPLGDPRTTDKFLPVPRAYGVTGWTFGAFFHRMTDAFHKEDPRAFEDWGRRFLSELGPGFTAWYVTVPIELTANYQFYKAMPIEHMGDQYKRKEDRYGPYTTEISKLLGKKFEASPRKIDHALFQATGHLGRLLANFADGSFRMLGIADAGEKPAATMRDRWWFGPSISDTTASGADTIDRLYKELEKADLIDVPRNNEELRLIAERDNMRSVANTLRDLRKEAQEVRDNPDLSPERKRVLIDFADVLQINIARQYYGLETIPLPELDW